MDIKNILGYSRPTIYKYLKILEDENEIFSRKIGAYTLYFSSKAGLFSIKTITSYYKALLKALKANLNDDKMVMKKNREEIQQRIAAFQEGCKQNGLRVTHQRLEIFRELAGACDHPSAEMIFTRVRKRIPTMSFDTVYRTLNTFEETKLISRVGVISGRARFEANMERHHHFLCTECGAIIDVYSKKLDNARVAEDLPDEINVESARVELRGVCSACRQA